VTRSLRNADPLLLRSVMTRYPNGVGSILVNGINAAGDLVGFYTDAAGNTDGMLATP
jgi:hypothetical protein